MELPVPPFNEQKRIANKLDAVLARVDACRDHLDRIPAILKRFRQSVLASATSGKLTEDWRNSNPHLVVNFSPRELTLSEREEAAAGKRVKIPRSFIEQPDSDIPNGWCWCSIDEAILKITDGTHHSPQSFSSGDFMYVTSKNVREGYIDLKGITYVSEEVHREIYARCDVKKSDVLYVKDGANTGLACVSTFEEEISLLSSVGVLRCCSFLMPKFLEHTLNSPETRTRMLNQMSGNAITRLTLEKIATSAIPIAPIEEQFEIVRRIEALFACADRLEARYTTTRAQVEKLTPSTLAKAFRGELVPQDPNDEPASALLERIKSGRADGATKPKRARTTDSAYVPKKLKEKSNMTKSRQDDDVREQPYLAAHLRRLGGAARVESLFDASELPVADFYKQLAWEVSKNMVRDAGEKLELGDAA